MQNIEKWENAGLTFNLAMNLKDNNELKAWFTVRLFIALIPGVGTIINGALDIIAQIGMQFKANGASSVQSNVQKI